MTPAKQQQLLQGQTALARKIFESVPIQTAWTPIQIKGAMGAGTATEVRVIRGCLRELQDCGLIREPQHGVFQRIDVRKPKPCQQQEQAMPQPKQMKKGSPGQGQSPIEILGDLAGQLTALAEQLKALAARIEEEALRIEQERESDADDIEKIKQLQTLLRSFGKE